MFRKKEIKFEDWNSALDFFVWLISVQSHIGVLPYRHLRTAVNLFFLFLGKQFLFYCFNVLPFGLTSAPYTVLLNVWYLLSNFWRNNRIDKVLYLADNGLLRFGPNFQTCVHNSIFIRDSLLNDGGPNSFAQTRTSAIYITLLTF
jgi:hypothetical protein